MTLDAFAVLGISPTRDAALIKQAYFRALGKTPPHSDPEGFRRVRAAYEELSDPRARCMAWLRAPVDTPAEHEAWEQRMGAEVASAAQSLRQQQQDACALDDMIERLAGMSFADARSFRG